MIEKMKFLRITGPKEDINRVISTYLNKYDMHIENALSELSDIKDLTPYVDTINVREIISRSHDTIEQLKKQKEISNKAKQEDQSSNYINESVEMLEKMHLLLDDLEVQKNRINQEIKDLNEKEKKLFPYLETELDFSKLKKYQFISYQFGRISIDYYDKMMKYVYLDMNIMFLEAGSDKRFVYGVYFVPKMHQTKADAILSSLHFEDCNFPEEYTGTPKDMYQAIEQKIAEKKQELNKLKDTMVDVLKKHEDQFIKAYDTLNSYAQNSEIRKLAACTRAEGEVYYILCGWMSEKDTRNFRKEIKEDSLVNCLVDDNSSMTTSAPPTKLKNLKLFRPFELYIRMYGLPNYGEFDPTAFVAITYSFLFGMMYGDVGQGLCLMIGGFLLYKKKKQKLCGIISCAGIFSTIFGFLYGSIFGFEDVLSPIWVNPMKDTMTVLITAVGLGIGLILLAMVFNIINGIRQKNIQKIFFDTNGVAGLAFYGTLIVTGLLLVTGHTIKAVWVVVLMLILPLILILLREPLTNLIKKRKQLFSGSSIGMYFVENGFQLFEVLLSYMTNTISFVRVGAFALCHAGMMSVVLLLGHAGTQNPNVIVIILGNLFVAGLEGLIVGIQVLRLEYYEMFSRFYQGDGKEFKASRSKN